MLREYERQRHLSMCSPTAKSNEAAKQSAVSMLSSNYYPDSAFSSH